MGKVKAITRKLVCFPIKLYQYLLSPFIKPSCRFYPSCSHYAEQAIGHFGVFKGLRLALLRILRCNPWSKGGFDPVLPNDEKE
ncbi:Protein YidD (plasmid) [Legionella adelaidensis]|uniref:Putative membrane protein insertion efficiency factor n=1 Tax=Legionella adelaidensis TaxID=45056 RepID=A0A0W0R132_9GAMM|nr:membrane protein insertion efficiency factor YidD [Legionella adelaidensis]KTC64803.1 putative membrane protein insertion efficiency factor [Legionella adelaidensis]VEH86207.1 Protein YidD [Legionella adelaidensis]